MPRLLHVADVHLGARHQDLGDAAARQRERQFTAFRRAVDVALEEHVDVLLIAGDLFDSNSQPRRSVERAATELRRLVDAGGRAVLLPGTHDAYDRASIYRTYDLASLAGLSPGSDAIVLLTPHREHVRYPELELVVFGRCFATKRAPHSPFTGFSAAHPPARWRVGMIHGSLRVPGRVEDDDVLFTEEEIAASNLDYLALGHWHSFREGRAGATTWAYSGAPEPVAIDQDGAGHVLLVTLEERDGERRVAVEPRRVGVTRFRRLEIDAADVGTQGRRVERLRGLGDPNLVLEVRLNGVTPDTLDLREDEVQRQLEGAFFRLRIRDRTVPPLPEGARPPADTIVGAFLERLERRIAEAEAAGDDERAAESREALRLGRLLLDDPDRVVLA